MIVTYHEVTPDPSRYVYSVTTAQFEEHLSAAAELVRRAPEALLTFDDGHQSHHQFAAPALSRSGLKATFFVTAGWTGNRPEYMTGAQLRELVAEGHSVQSHGWSHALLTRCSPDDLAAELRNSRLALEDCLGRPVDAISIPGGRCGREVLRQCAHQGYRRVFTSDLHPGVRHLFGLAIRGRAMVKNKFTAQDLVALLHSQPGAWSPPRVLFACKRAARSLAGDALYHRLWELLGSSRGKALIDSQYKEPRA